jgi:tetratricopeptide (TPR) repeat protein
LKKIFIILNFCLCFTQSSLNDIEILFNNGNLLEAESLISTFPEKNEDFYYLAYQVYFQLDDLNNANKNLQQALSINEDRYFDEGDQLGLLINDLKNVNKTLTSGFIDEAIEESLILIKKYPDNSICYYRLGYAYKENKDYTSAISNFNQAIDLNPYNSVYKDEVTYISNLEMLKGKEMYDLKDYQLALEHFNKALEYDPSNAAAMFRIGNIYYSIRDYIKAANIYEKGLILKNNNYKVFNIVGKCYVALNETEKALNAFDKSLEINPEYSSALFEKSKLFRILNQIEESTKILNSILIIDATYLKAYELLMDIEVGLKNLNKAIDYGNSALAINPTAYAVQQRLASVYNQQKIYSKGREFAKASLKSKKNYAPALFELGIAELSLCNKVAAKDAFTKCKRNRNYRKAASDYLKPDNFEHYSSHCQ